MYILLLFRLKMMVGRLPSIHNLCIQFKVDALSHSSLLLRKFLIVIYSMLLHSVHSPSEAPQPSTPTSHHPPSVTQASKQPIVFSNPVGHSSKQLVIPQPVISDKR